MTQLKFYKQKPSALEISIISYTVAKS